MELILKAMDYANQAHKNQVRKGSKLPYIVHPFAVGMILKEQGCSEEMIAAGILHDTIEDTDATYEDIKTHFGETVAFYVISVTEPDKTKSWDERKQHTIDKLKNAPIEVKLIKAADKYHNLYSITQEVNTKGDKAWSVFSKNKEKQKWYAQEAYQSIIANVENREKYPLFTELKKIIDQLFAE